MKEDYPVFVKWSKVLDWILDRVEKFPKNVRFTLSGRIANISLDILEGLIEAIYIKNRIHILERQNLYIEKLRVLFRICYERHYISIRQYEYITEELDETGRMLGGWIRSEKGQGSV